MLKERARLLNASVFTLDLALVTAAFVLAHWLRDAFLPSVAAEAFPTQLYALGEYLPLLPIALVIFAATLLATGRYRSHRTVPIIEEAWGVVQASGAGAVLFTLVLYAFRLDERVLESDRVSRIWLLLFASLSCAFLLTEKLALRTTSRYVRSRGLNYRTLVIVGTGAAAQGIARSIEEHSYWGFRLAGFVAAGDDHPAEVDAVGGHPVLGTPDDLQQILQEHAVDDVVFAVGRRELGEMEDLFLALEEQGIRTLFALNFFPHTQARVELAEVDGIPLLTFSTAPSGVLQLAAKRAVDVALSSFLLLVGWPVVIAVALLIKLSGGGSILFRQTRCGLNGRRFVLYKFRTMIEGAEERRHEVDHLNEMDGPVFKARRDPRVTRLGRLLRKFSLDEIPQLWNVLRGDMSLVGPRPPIPEEVAQYERWQRRRLSMKPGITCLWQIAGRNDIDFSRWIELDLEYIDSWSLGLDFEILLKTIPVVLSGKGAS